MSAPNVPCPRCPAKAGEPCLDRSGNPRSLHAGRTRLAVTGTHQRAPRTAATAPNPEKNRPMMNRQAFTCPRCGVWSAEYTAKIVKDRNEWVHQRCVTAEKNTVLRERYPQTVNVDLCATCRGRLHSGNRTVNVHGAIVHANGCPTRRHRPSNPAP